MEIESKIVYQILVPYIIGMITIVAPISVSIISSLDTRYNSSRIIRLFRSHGAIYSLIIFIILNIIGLVSYIIDVPRIWNFGFLNSFIDHSAFWLFVINCSISLFIFGWFMWTIIKFLDAKELTKYIIKKLIIESKTNQDNSNDISPNIFKKTKHFICRKIFNRPKNKYANLLSDMFIYTLKKENSDISRDITNTIIKLKPKHLKKNGSDTEYDPFFFAIHKSFEENTIEKRSKILNYYNKTFLSYFLTEDINLNDLTKIWKLLKMTVENNNVPVFKSYWEYANSFAISITHKNETRESFLIFNFFLNSYLLYLKEYSLLKYTLHYTDSKPADYQLVPSTFTEVIDAYCFLCKKENSIFDEIVQSFKFTDSFDFSEELLNIDESKKYCAILFIRLFSLKPYYWGVNTLELPNSPRNSEDCLLILNKIIFLENQINNFLEEKKEESLINHLQIINEKPETEFSKKEEEIKSKRTEKINDKETKVKSEKTTIDTIKTKTISLFRNYRSQLEKDLKSLEIKDAIDDFNKEVFPRVIQKLKYEKEVFHNPKLTERENVSYLYINGEKEIFKTGIINRVVDGLIITKIEDGFSAIIKNIKAQEYYFTSKTEIDDAIQALQPKKNNLLVLISGYTKPNNKKERTIFDTMTDKSISIEGDEKTVKWLNSFEGHRAHDYALYILPKHCLPHFNLENFTNKEKEEIKKDKAIPYSKKEIKEGDIFYNVCDLEAAENKEFKKDLERRYGSKKDNSIFYYINFIGKYTYNPSTPILCFRVGKNDENNIGKIKEIKNEFLDLVKEEKHKSIANIILNLLKSKEPPKQIEGS